MISSEKEKLFSYADGTRIGIGVSATGIPYSSIQILWQRNSSAYNMRTPDVFLCPEDLQDPEVLAALDRCRVIGFYSFCALEDYGFLCRFTELQDLYLDHAEKLTDPSFLKHMPDLFMLFLHKADLPDLDPLAEIMRGSRLHSYCLGLDSCRVGDIRALVENERPFSELLLWNADSEDVKRWKEVRSLTFAHYPKD